ncbi:MAG: beta-N-acetylhexosaminidase [Clostridia bacterium]|nr:beta-N-acetylhexosaminidase [Clostridia bacterium]
MEKMLGVMLDCSRNAVMKPDKVKEFAQIIKKMGLNTLMLYTEDTYEIESQPYFGHLRGRYSKQELKDIDSYCQSIGIELIPCIQTLAHLKQMFKWHKIYSDVNDCDDILLIGEEKTYLLIEDMLKTLSECFTSRKIHIGMDEAYRVGTGNYAIKNGMRDKFDIINEHLHKVCDIAGKYNFEPMIWSDMFCKLAADQDGYGDQYGEVDTAKVLERAALPENVSLVYWDYYHSEYDHYDKMIKRNKLFNRKVYFAGGAWTWGGFAPYNAMSIERTDAAISACNDNEIDGVFLTVWGDNGAECNPFTILPTLMFAAEKMRGNTDMDSIKKKFYEIVGTEFDSFVLLESFDSPGGMHKDNNSASKYLLYNDPFVGLNDCFCAESDNEFYANLAQKLSNVEKGNHSNIFESYENLAGVLSLKAALGVKTRKAYLANDKEALKEIIKEYDETILRLKAFHASFQSIWLEYNKPHGFDAQDLRLGGLIQRLLSCKDRLENFVSGQLPNIPELEEKVLENPSPYGWWNACVSVNIV